MKIQSPALFLSVDEVLDRVLQGVPVLDPVPVPLSQGLGLVLAEEVRSPEDFPAFDNSAFDGYAVCSGDFSDGEILLEVVGEVSAGRLPEISVASGQALRIATGAPMPAGADAVVMVEETRPRGGQVLVRGPVSAGQNVRRAGEALHKGQLVLSPGQVLDPAALGMAATIGLPTLRCHPRPRISLIVTGDELVEPGQPLGPGQIHDANSYTLESLLRLAGAEPSRSRILEDRLEVLQEALSRSAAEADLILTSAGVSMGERDLVRTALEALGGELDLWKVRMRPGRPMAFGSLGGVPVLCLAGNPVSSMIGFEVFVRPALRKMAGHPAEVRRVLRARMAEAVDKPEPMREFVRGRLTETAEGSLQVRLTGSQSSGILLSMLEAQVLAILPEGVARVEAGDEVEVRLLDHLDGWRPLVRP